MASAAAPAFKKCLPLGRCAGASACAARQSAIPSPVRYLVPMASLPFHAADRHQAGQPVARCVVARPCRGDARHCVSCSTTSLPSNSLSLFVFLCVVTLQNSSTTPSGPLSTMCQLVGLGQMWMRHETDVLALYLGRFACRVCSAVHHCLAPCFVRRASMPAPSFLTSFLVAQAIMASPRSMPSFPFCGRTTRWRGKSARTPSALPTST